MQYSHLITILASIAVSLSVGVSGAVANPAALASSPTDTRLQRGMDLYEKEQYKDALDLWIPLAAQGVPQAQYYLGVAYSNGTGMPKNSVRATEWLTRAAAKGLPIAEVALGLNYANGEGVLTNPSSAVSWYRKAADQGDSAGQFHLGLMYAGGTGVPKDSAQAVAWYRKSSAQGNASGQFLLASAFRTGTGVPRDLEQALDLYQKSARQGFEGAKIMAEVIADTKLHEAFQALPTRGTSSTAFPRAPVTRRGVSSCNTLCNNGQCRRTYDDGRHVEFQARHNFNAFTNEWEWDSGSC